MMATLLLVNPLTARVLPPRYSARKGAGIEHRDEPRHGTAVGADYRFLLFPPSRLCAARRRHQLSLANGLGSRPSDDAQSMAIETALAEELARF